MTKLLRHYDPSQLLKSLIAPPLLLLLLWGAGIGVVLTTSHGGLMGVPTMGVDWAHTMALADHIGAYGEVRSYSPSDNLQEMRTYPPWSHWSIVLLARLLGISTLRSIQILIAVLIVTGCMLVAVRVMSPLQRGGQSPTLLGVCLAAVFLAVFEYAGIDLPGHIRYNFFYAQLFGTVLAIACYILLRKLKAGEISTYLFVVLVGGIILPRVHLVPALWFNLAALIYLVFTADWRAKTAGNAAALSVVVGLLGLLNPSVLAITRMSYGFNQDFNIRWGTVRSWTPVVGLLCLALMVVALGSVRLVRKAQGSWRAILAQHAGLASILTLVSFQVALGVVMHRSSIYSACKYTYILCVELSVFVSWVFAEEYRGADNRLSGESILLPQKSAWVAVAAGLLFMSQQPFLEFVYDQSQLILMQEGLAGYHKANPGAERRYPQFQSFPPPVNYYLAIGVLEIPRDARTMGWFLERHATGEVDLPVGHAVPAKCYGYSLTLADARNNNLRGGGRGGAFVGQIGPGLFPLVARVTIPYGQWFHMAERLPVGPAEVALGYRVRTADGGLLREERSVLMPLKEGDATTFRATILEQKLEPSAATIDIGLVQEGVIWFDQRTGATKDKVVLVR